MADAAHLILTRPARAASGQFHIDDILLYESGVRDFDRYRIDPTKAARISLFVPDRAKPPPGVHLDGD